MGAISVQPGYAWQSCVCGKHRVPRENITVLWVDVGKDDCSELFIVAIALSKGGVISEACLQNMKSPYSS